MKRTLFPTLILALLAVLLISLPLVAQASDVPWDSECLAFQSGYHNHDWRWQSEEPATCLHGKVTHYKCRNCGNTCTVRDSALAPHVFPSTWDTQKAPTCTEAGTDIHFCTVCKNASETRNVPALGHNWSEWQTVTEPTCTKTGTKVHSCSRCRERETWSIPALGHNYQRSVAQQPTCTSDGMAIQKCSRCGDSYREPIPATGHSWQNDHKDATCTAAGYDRQKCSKCGAVQNEKTLPATGHNWGAWQQGDVATCVQYGNRYHDCSKCGAREWERDYASGLGDHDWGEWVIVKEPTATEDGLKERVCKVDASHKEQEVIPATGEEIEPWIKIGFTYPTPYKSTYDETNLEIFDVASVESNYIMSYFLCFKYESNGSWHKYLPFGGSSDDCFEPGEYSVPNLLINTAYSDPFMNHINPGTETDTLLGTVTVLYRVDGYNPLTGEKVCESNVISRTYKVKKSDEEPKPALLLTVVPTRPEKEAYTYTDQFVSENYNCYKVIYTNIGNVPLLIDFYRCRGAGFTVVERTVFSGGTLLACILEPGKSFDGFCIGFYLTNSPEYFVADPEDSPYAGSYPLRFKGNGYAVDDKGRTTPICESNVVDFNYKFAKPGPAGWEIPEESQLSVTQFEDGMSSDPAGYQLAEPYTVKVTVTNTGAVDLDSYTLELPFTGSSITAGPIAASESQTFTVADATITEDDVNQGYIFFPPVTVKWVDPDSGNENPAISESVTLTVLSKTGLLLKKGVANTPAEGYFNEGDQIEWSLSMKNNSKEPIKDITITDKGATIGMFAELTPEQGEIKLGVPKYTVTEYDAKVTGKVINYAVAKGTDLKGVEHTYTSNPAIAKTKPDDGGDPLGPIYGVHPAVSIIKAEAHKAASGDWYALDEMIDYTITVKNTGDTPLTNIQVYDSLGGFVPIGSCASLAVNEEKTFTFSWKTTEHDVNVTGYVVNQATVTYDFLGSVHGTPMTSNKVSVNTGENDIIIIGGYEHFDPDILHTAGDSCCALTLNYAGDGTAYYT
ncbi:MAG: hypothetical protein IK133_03190, partial [Clostridia bacterium]|nr:hypothetical protein [Clostridia bacterium]